MTTKNKRHVQNVSGARIAVNGRPLDDGADAELEETAELLELLEQGAVTDKSKTTKQED